MSAQTLVKGPEGYQKGDLPVLEARVKARNRAAQVATELQKVLREFFAPLEGEKILKVDGGLLAKHILPEFPRDSGLMVYRHASDYSLAWVVKTNENIEGKQSCVYEEVVIYVGELNNQVLTSLSPESDWTTHTAEKVVELRKQYKEVKDLADKAKSRLHPFGEYDH